MTFRLLLTGLFLTSVTFSNAQERDSQSILNQIDDAIEQSPKTVEQYERQIEDIRLQYVHARQANEKYEKAFKLFELYKAFMNDSALYYLNEAEHWAGQQGKVALVGNCRALKAFQCSTVGYYNEALSFLKHIDIRSSFLHQ